MSIFKEFTNKYSVEKTLRFALKPIEKTEEKIKEKQIKGKEGNFLNFLKKDEKRAEAYKKAKKIIDEYHKWFIDDCLEKFYFDIEEDLNEFKKNYFNLKNDKNNTKLQEKLRKKISKNFIADDVADKSPFGKKFIEGNKDKKSILITWLEKEYADDQEEFEKKKKIIEEFKGWTTYFKGFEENRKNIYTHKDHSTAIGYRLIHENLPKFLENLKSYKEAKELEIDFSSAGENLQDLAIDHLDAIFTLENFNQCLTQSGIDKYNQVIGGKTKEDGTKLKGINECVNLHGQKLVSEKKGLEGDAKKEQEKKIKKVYSCKMKELYKQILSDRESTSFRLEGIKNDQELCEDLKIFYFKDDDLFYNGDEKFNLTEKLKNENEKNIFKILEEGKADFKKVYIRNDVAITDISKFIFGQHHIIKEALEYYFENKKLIEDKKGKPKKYTKTQAEKKLKKDYFSFEEIHCALKFYFDHEKNPEEIEIKEKALLKYFKSLQLTSKQTNQKINVLETIKENFEGKKNEKGNLSISEVLEKYNNDKEALKKNKEDKEERVLTIKNYLDSVKNLQFFLKPLYIKFKKSNDKKQNLFDKDNAFYSEFDPLYENLVKVNQLYDQIRNYLTKKPFSVEKYKLNFENSTLAGGWDKNKEENKNNTVIFREGNKYYLGIIDKDNKEKKGSFSREDLFNTNSNFEKMEYKDLGDIKRQIPRIAFSDKAKNGEENLGWSEKIQKIKDEFDEFQNEKKANKDKWKNEFDKEKLNRLINYYKSVLENHSEEYVKNYEIKFKETASYKNLGDFFDDVQNQTYKIIFIGLNKDKVLKLVEGKKLYLFEIYSKDFSSYSKGKKNLQTLYWENLFSEENLKDVVYKLNGNAELFFRRASIEYSKGIWEKGHHADDPKKKQAYPIIKDKRYAKDTYLFHVPITCNFKTKGISKFNNTVLKTLKNNKGKVNIIGIDRGERHLAYYTVINSKGEILEQRSFNKPLGKKDYHELLETREKKRKEARESWGMIEKIRDLKAGYLSQVVHEICQLMIKHEAIVVLEDLNFGFKKGRFKVEKQVYQKLEKALIDKLNYLVFKDKKSNELGGVFKGLQLTDQFKSFQKMGKQTGFIFYVPAYHTSKICPKTGFVNLLYPKYETIKKAKDFFNGFEKIYFNGENFEFHFDYEKIYKSTKSPTGLEGCKKNWVIYSYGKRLENFKNDQKNHNWESREIDPNEELKKLFDENGIDYKNKGCIKEKICNQEEKKFFKELINFLKLTLQMRNSKMNDDEDYLISPVKDDGGNFFDSRKVKDEKLPKDADANGAYHIALRGLQLLKKIDETKEEDLFKFKIDADNKSWYTFVQDKENIRKGT